ncbi:hypothetical protein ES703_91130 [subsurface metagenome]
MNKLIEVKYISAKKGKGVFAKKNIRKGTKINIAHIILISNKEWDLIEDTVLSNYSYNPNVKYVYDYKNKCIEHITIRDISKDEEITVNYNGEPFNKSPVWFEVEDVE